MTIRKEKEKDFYVKHIETFKKLKLSDPFFLIKTAFFQKGKYGRQVQFFESELSKGEDIYLEFYDNVTDANGSVIDITPFFTDRQLFKYRHNPFYAEEYETKNGTNYKGEPYNLYTVPMAELLAVLPNGTEITYALYEKRKAEAEAKKEDEELPKLQNSLSLFPDFDEQFNAIKPKEIELISEDDSDLQSMSVRDFAAIMLKSPVSKKQWLNDLILKLKQI